MTATGHRPGRQGLDARLATSGLRSTRQREHVYQVLLARRDHPTAEELFLRAKRGLPHISLATVYNCLDALVNCGLVRQVHVDRSATRFCPNMREHSHFYCEGCGRVFDLQHKRGAGPAGWALPRGFAAAHCELSVRGLCPSCQEGEKSS
jgi:Fur family peroxide stress response transcriptional regulator